MNRVTRLRVGGLSGAVVALALILAASAVGSGVAPDSLAGPSTPRHDTIDNRAPTDESATDGVVTVHEESHDRRSDEVIVARNQDETTTRDRQKSTTLEGEREATTAGGQGATAGNASRFEIVDVSTDVDVGESGTLTVAIRNVGNQLIRNATVTVASTSSDVRFASDGEQSTVYAGAIEPGEVERVPVDVTVSSTAEQRRYVLDVTMRYQLDAGESRQTEMLLAEFTPGTTQDLDIEAENSSLYVDETGTLRGELVNDGIEDIEDAVLVLEGTDNRSGLVGVPDNRQVLGEVAAGQSESFEFEVDVGPNVEPGLRQFRFHVEYEDEDEDEGRLQRSPVLVEEWSIQERREQFELQNVESTLRIDEEGEVSGEIVNQRDEPARDAVLLLQGPGGNVSGPISVTETEYALGDLDPDEATNFSFDVDMSAQASSGPRQFTFRVRYVDEDGETTRSDPLYARVGVGEERDRFRVEPVNASLPAGSNDVVRLRVTNVGNEPLTDVSGKLFVDDPLSAEDDEAFISRLEPNESATLVYRVSVADDALAKEYPLSVDFEYTDADGDTQLSKTYRVGLSVRPSEGDGLPLPFAIGGVVALTALVIAVGVRR